MCGWAQRQRHRHMMHTSEITQSLHPLILEEAPYSFQMLTLINKHIHIQIWTASLAKLPNRVDCPILHTYISLKLSLLSHAIQRRSPPTRYPDYPTKSSHIQSHHDLGFQYGSCPSSTLCVLGVCLPSLMWSSSHTWCSCSINLKSPVAIYVIVFHFYINYCTLLKRDT